MDGPEEYRPHAWNLPDRSHPLMAHRGKRGIPRPGHGIVDGPHRRRGMPRCAHRPPFRRLRSMDRTPGGVAGGAPLRAKGPARRVFPAFPPAGIGNGGFRRIAGNVILDPPRRVVTGVGGTSLGVSRNESIERSRQRVPLEDYRLFLNHILQGERLGIGLSRSLRGLSGKMLENQDHRAETIAQQAAVKLLFPLVCFIFPAVFLIILSPVILGLWGRFLR
jgi:hypothetical protein